MASAVSGLPANSTRISEEASKVSGCFYRLKLGSGLSATGPETIGGNHKKHKDLTEDPTNCGSRTRGSAVHEFQFENYVIIISDRDQTPPRGTGVAGARDACGPLGHAGRGRRLGAERAKMDLIVARTGDPTVWVLNDLLERDIGSIVEAPSNTFNIHVVATNRDLLGGLKLGPYTSLDSALAAIETHTRGICRRMFAEDQHSGASVDPVPAG